MTHSYTTLEIKLNGFGKPMIERFNKTLRVTCVDGNTYIHTYTTWQQARSNLKLIAIVPEWDWVKV